MAINPNEINIKNIVELIQSSSIKDNDLLVIGQGIYARKSTVLELYNKFGVPSILTSLNSLQFQINQLNNTLGNSVLYSPQVKTPQQKADARNNLDVYSRSETQTVVNTAIVNLGNVVNSVNGVNVDNTDPKNPIVAEFRPIADYNNDMLNKADIDGNLTTGGIWFQDQVLSDRFANYKQVWTSLTNNTIEWGNIELDKHIFLVDDIDGMRVRVGGVEGTIWNTLNLTNVSQLNNDAGYLQANDLDGFIYDVTYNSAAHTITFYQQNEPNIVVDLPIEQLIKGVQLVGNDLVFTFEDGSTVTVPLNTLLVGVVKSVNGLTPNSQGEIVLQITDIPNLSSELSNKLDIRMAGLVSNLTQPEKDAILSKLGVVNNIVQVLGLSGNTITLSNGGGSISLNIANIGGLQTALDGKASTSGHYSGLSVGNATQWSGQIYNQGAISGNTIGVFMTHNGSGWGYTSIPQVQSALGINTSWNLQQVTNNGASTTNIPIFNSSLGQKLILRAQTNNIGDNYFSFQDADGSDVAYHGFGSASNEDFTFFLRDNGVNRFQWYFGNIAMYLDQNYLNVNRTISTASHGTSADWNNAYLATQNLGNNFVPYIGAINHVDLNTYSLRNVAEVDALTNISVSYDNSTLTVGHNRDIGFIKKAGFAGKLIVGNSNPFEVVMGNSTAISKNAADTFTSLFKVNTDGTVQTLGGINTPLHGTSADWNTAYNWGNHADAGYVTTAVTGFRSGTNPYQQGLINLQAGANITISQNSTTKVWTFSATDTDTITNIGANGVVGTSGNINFQGIGGTEITKVGNTLSVSQSSLRTTFHNITATSTLPNDSNDKVVHCTNDAGIILTLPNGQRNGQRIEVYIIPAGGVYFSGQLFIGGLNVSTLNKTHGTYIFIWNANTNRWWGMGG